MTEPDAPDAAHDPSAELYARQMANLRDLAEFAMDFIGDLRLEATLGKGAGPRETAETFERYARGVRLTIAMERRLQAEEAERLAPDAQTLGALAILAARSAAPRPEASAGMGPPADYTRAVGRRDVVTNLMHDMIRAHDAEHADFDRAEAFREFERLIDKDVADEEALNRPILEVVALICKELGVEPDWSLWAPEDWTEPRWGLTQVELSEAAHPSPYQPCSVRWPPPGTVMPLPGLKPAAPPTPSPP
jgi:hypothetical protein